MGSIDLVLFTGDITQRGTSIEFKKVNDLLKRFWEEFSRINSEPKFLAVPGNHALDRPKDLEDDALINLMELWDNPKIQSRFWEDHKSRQREIVEAAFRSYVEWFENIPFPKAGGYSSGLLPGDSSATFEKESVKLGIL